jgi:hypothetical protein
MVTQRRPKVHHEDVFRLLDAGVSQKEVAQQFGCDPSYISHLKRRRAAALANGHPPSTALQPQTLVGEPSADVVPNSADVLSDHETRLQVLESFVATLQAQAIQPPVQQITVQSSAESAYALPSAEPVQTWDDPEDAKPERWNLWLPRGLKRHIEAHAKAAGIAPSQLVQRLLMSALPRPEGGGHA